ncbi:MAG: hypothetical protein V1775_00405 [Bacteroidota bacterium]
MKERFILFCTLFTALNFALNAQQAVQKKEYYDWTEKQIKRTWHELGDGTYHGVEKAYYESGELAYTYKYVKGKVTYIKALYEDGQPSMEIYADNESNYNGIQSYYFYENGNHYLKAQAKAIAGVFSEFKSFNNSGEILWSYHFNGTVKEYKEYENEKLVTHLKFENSHVTGIIGNEVIITDNYIQSINSINVKADLVDTKLHVSDGTWSSYQIRIYDFKCDMNVCLNITHPSRGKMFDFRMQIIKKDGQDTEMTDNMHREHSGFYYTEIYEEFNDLYKLTDYLLGQYVMDGKAVKKELGITEMEAYYDKGNLISETEFDYNGKVIRETYFDYGKLKTEKKFDTNGQVLYEFRNNVGSWYNTNQTLKHQEFYNDNNNVICIRKYENGTIQYINTFLTNMFISGEKYDELSKLQYFDANGKIQKEEIVIGDRTLKYKIFDTIGNITDSDELRAELNNYYTKGNNASNQASNIYTEIKEKMFRDFCMDENGVLSTGPSGFQKAIAAAASALDEPYNGIGNQSTPECYNKKNKNIYEAIKILYTDYIFSVSKFNQTIIEKKLAESYFAETFVSVSEQISFYEERYNVYNDVLNLCTTFSSYIIKFDEVVNSPSCEELNKQFKKKSDINEIRSIFGLQ